jgi:hypothetical protein
MNRIVEEVLSANRTYGYLYDVKSGALVEVPEATGIGAVVGPA